MIDVDHTYSVYKLLRESGIITQIKVKLELEDKQEYNDMFEKLCDKVINLTDVIQVGIVGK